jgi:hypothetical protein
MKNPRQNTKSKPSLIKKEKLILVREGLFFGLTIERSKSDKNTINRGIVSTPNFVFYSSNTKCLIDYTNQTNDNIIEPITKFFTQLETGTTLNLYNGIYTDTNSNIEADLTGQYTFRSYINGIVRADVVSVESLSSNISRYDKTRFNNIPFFVSNTIEDQTFVTTVVKNKFGKNTKNSFNYLGVKVGDYVRIGMEEPKKVTEINVDSDGSEYIVLDAQLTVQDLTSTPTKVEILISVVDSYRGEPRLDESVGACIEYFNGVVVSCTDNHTPSQCRLRASTTRGIITEITTGTFCSTPETDTSVQTNITENLVQVTSALAAAISNTTTISGPILKGTNSKNSFYGRPF